MKSLKHIVISIFSLALCVLVTFAWINELQNPEGRVIALRMNNAAIATSELEVKLSVNVEDDVFDDITKYREDGVSKDLEAYENFAPGGRKKFKVDITNLSEAPVTLRVMLSDIVCESDELKSSIIVGTNGFSGFDEEYPAPTVKNNKLSDGIDSSGGFILVDHVEIPPDQPVSIYFYVLFSASGSANLENMSFSIGTINFLTL